MVGGPGNKLRQMTDARELKRGAPGIGKIMLNLGTGIKVTNINTDQVREIEAIDKARDFLQGKPNIRSFENLYIRKGDRGKVHPDDLRTMLLLNQMRRTPRK